jgi:hypothetical protein
MTGLVVVAALAGGYVAAIYSWPKLRVAINGAQAEVASLRARADALANAIKTRG